MTIDRSTFARLATDVKISLLVCTRLPLAHNGEITGNDIAHASWAFPLAGALVGCIGAVAYAVAFRLRLPPGVAAALALAVTMIVTGCLHEDGLADTADGFGGGRDRDRKLEIMRDSRIGTYGACALLISLLVRWSALAVLAQPPPVMLALIAAHAAARAPLPLFMRLVPPARADGLSADAGRPSPERAVAAVVLGLIALVLALGLLGAILGVVLIALVGLLLARLSVRQIGGQTGDVIGTAEQVNEMLILAIASMLLTARVAP